MNRNTNHTLRSIFDADYFLVVQNFLKGKRSSAVYENLHFCIRRITSLAALIIVSTPQIRCNVQLQVQLTDTYCVFLSLLSSLSYLSQLILKVNQTFDNLTF